MEVVNNDIEMNDIADKEGDYYFDDYDPYYDYTPTVKEEMVDDPDDSDERSRSTWGSDFSNEDEDETKIINDKGETIIIQDENKLLRVKRGKKIKYTEDLFLNILELDSVYTDVPFINHLLDSNTFSISRELSDSGLVNDYSVKYIGGDFRTIGRALTMEDIDLLRDNIMEDINTYTREKWRKKI